MSWQNIMNRVLPPIGGVPPHITSPFGAVDGRKPPSTIPHGGVDFNYFGGKEAALNKTHPALRSPVAGIVTNAGQGSVGRIAIKDANGFSHEILHTQTRHVSIGDPVAAGQLIGTMGNTGTKDHHVHYQLKDADGHLMDPTTYWDQQGPVDSKSSPPAHLEEYKQYLQDNGAETRTGSGDVLATEGYPRLSRSMIGQSRTPGNEVLSPDRPASLNERFGSWNSSQEGITPRNPSLPVPLPETGRPLGIFSGKPMQQWITPPPIYELTKSSRASGIGSRKSSRPSASMFDAGTSAVPFVTSGPVSAADARNSVAKSLADGGLAPSGNSSDNRSLPTPQPQSFTGSTSPVLQYLQYLKQQNGDSSQVPMPSSAMATGPVPTNNPNPPIGGLLARLAAAVGIDPDDPDNSAPSSLPNQWRGLYRDDQMQPRSMRGR